MSWVLPKKYKINLRSLKVTTVNNGRGKDPGSAPDLNYTGILDRVLLIIVFYILALEMEAEYGHKMSLELAYRADSVLSVGPEPLVTVSGPTLTGNRPKIDEN